MPESSVKSIEGALIVPEGAKFAIVGSRFNAFIVERLVEGAVDALKRHGADPKNITVVRVPGAWEIPLVAARLAGGGKVDAIVALGAVIRGSTPHFDYVAGEASRGIAAAASEAAIPVTFGVLTTDTIEQALERADTKAGNKGYDAAIAAIELAQLFRALQGAPRAKGKR